jgi:FkbM family methyltransferase
MKPSKLDTLAYNLLVKTSRLHTKGWRGRFWYRLHEIFAKRSRLITTTIHNRPVVANFGYTYSFTVRQFPNFNAPLLAAVKAMADARKRKIRLVDVGAAIGDTVLLVEANLGNLISEYICVDGNDYFFEFLKANTSHLPNIRLFKQLLADKKALNPNLVMTHLGTASALGSERIQALPLDDLFSSNKVSSVDMLKVDVDGFDGLVLSGAQEILKRDKPGVIFEWHPSIWAETKTDTRLPFNVLESCGYKNLIWFTNEGFFSGFSEVNNSALLNKMEKLCLSRRSNPYLHYDLVALPDDAADYWLDVAELIAWKSKVSPW